jgi:hypothetical protein
VNEGFSSLQELFNDPIVVEDEDNKSGGPVLAFPVASFPVPGLSQAALSSQRKVKVDVYDT